MSYKKATCGDCRITIETDMPVNILRCTKCDKVIYRAERKQSPDEGENNKTEEKGKPKAKKNTKLKKK